MATPPSLFSTVPVPALLEGLVQVPTMAPAAGVATAELLAVEEGRRKRAEYRCIKVIGSGTQGTVKLAVHLPTGLEVALKSVRKPHGTGRAKSQRETTANEVRREVAILRSFNHEHLCRFIDAFETNSKFYISMALCTGGSLFERIQTLGFFDETAAAVCVATIVNAVMYLHDHGIAHRDLKPENLLFRDKSPNSPLILVDFGVAGVSRSKSDDQGMRTIAGTPFFLAPELVTGSNNRTYTNKIDIWSIGVITYQLLVGTTPFQDSQSFGELYRRISTAQFDIPTSSPLSPLARDFIRTLLQPNPDLRPTAYQALRHPWIMAYCPRSYILLLGEFNVEADPAMYANAAWDGKPPDPEDPDVAGAERWLGPQILPTDEGETGTNLLEYLAHRAARADGLPAQEVPFSQPNLLSSGRLPLAGTGELLGSNWLHDADSGVARTDSATSVESSASSGAGDSSQTLGSSPLLSGAASSDGLQIAVYGSSPSALSGQPETLWDMLTTRRDSKRRQHTLGGLNSGMDAMKRELERAPKPRNETDIFVPDSTVHDGRSLGSRFASLPRRARHTSTPPAGADESGADVAIRMRSLGDISDLRCAAEPDVSGTTNDPGMDSAPTPSAQARMRKMIGLMASEGVARQG